MKPNTMDIFDLFQIQRRHLVPLFQRPYVWSKERQWQPLWEDIANIAEHLVEQAENEQSLLRKHFIGAVVLNQIKTFGLQLAATEIIDGQQRLTTLQILLFAVRDYMKATGQAGQEWTINHMTENHTNSKAKEERYKVWPTTSDQAVFESIFSAGSPQALEQRYPLQKIKYTSRFAPRPRLADAYLFFYAMTQQYVEFGEQAKDTATPPLTGTPQDGAPKLSPEETNKRLEALITALTKYLEVVVIELEERDDPQVIFETLNARGEPLLPSDLIRNFVFLEASRINADVNHLYQTYWHPFDDAERKGTDFWKEYVRQGRLTRPRLDLFFFHYLTYKTERDLPITHLFQEFRDWWADKPRVVETELSEFRKYSDIFAQLFTAVTTSRFEVFAQRISTLDTSTVYPLILLLLGEQRTGPDLDGIWVDIESYLVRRMLCGLTTKNYNRTFLSLLQNVRKAGTGDHATLHRLLSELQGESVEWPSDERFKRAWLETPVYDRLTKRRVSMILEAIEAKMRTSKQEEIQIHGALSIEHILPQNPSLDDWPLESIGLDQTAQGIDLQAYRNMLLHTFGNLTLLTQALNSSISNGPFVAKRKAIAQQSLLQLNAYFQDFEGKPWNEVSILARGEKLFEVAKVIWPGPEAAV